MDIGALRSAHEDFLAVAQAGRFGPPPPGQWDAERLGTGQTRMAEVSALRPPVRQSVLVRSSRAHTFETFVGAIGAWWPVNPFSAGRDRVRDVTVERRAGGRVYETWTDGTRVDWGEVLAWEPPQRFAMTWAIVSALTEVELTFNELGPALTRVSLVHRGWEKLSDEQLARDCALPGGYLNGSFDQGWALILAALAAAAGGPA